MLHRYDRHRSSRSRAACYSRSRRSPSPETDRCPYGSPPLRQAAVRRLQLSSHLSPVRRSSARRSPMTCCASSARRDAQSAFSSDPGSCPASDTSRSSAQRFDPSDFPARWNQSGVLRSMARRRITLLLCAHAASPCSPPSFSYRRVPLSQQDRGVTWSPRLARLSGTGAVQAGSESDGLLPYSTGIDRSPIIADEYQAIDRVTDLNPMRGTVTLRIMRGYGDDKTLWYISTDASAPAVAAMESSQPMTRSVRV